MSEKIDTGSYLHAIAHTDQYRNFQAMPQHERNHGGDYFHTRSRAIAMGSLALAQERTTGSEYRTPEGSMYNLIGHVDSFARAAAVLDSDHGYIKEATFNKLKRDLVEFNHALKEAAEKNPTVGFNELLAFMTQVYASSNGNEGARAFMGRARAAMVGMRHEIAAEQIIETTEGYEVDYEHEVTDEDDLHGVDIFVHSLRLGRTIGIDVKASQSTLARERYDDRYGDAERKVWSACSESDFGNATRLTPEQVAQKAPIMEREMDEAFAPLRGTA